MGLDDLGKQAVNSYKKWFMSIADKSGTYIDDAIETIGDPFKYNNVSNSSRKSSINRLTDFLNDMQEHKESSIKRINSVFEKAQQTDGDIIDEIRPIYQQALDKINTNMENVSIYEQQLTGLKNIEKYKEGTKAFKRGFDNVRGEEIVRQEIEIERIWDKERDAQRRLYEDVNKRYTQTYHPEIENRSYYSERNSSFLDDNALKQYEDLKQMAPGMIITEQSYNWETDIDRAHELALRENNQFDFVRQAEERERRRVNNRTTAQNQVNNSTATQNQVNTTQNQVSREQKKRRKSYADRTTKPINSEFNTAYYGQYNPQTRDYEYVDYKSHYSGGVSRSEYDEEWIEEKIFGEAHSNSEYGIEAPWSKNRVRNTNVPDVPDVPNPPPESTVNAANNTSTPINNLNKILNKTNPEKRMWTNRDFVFGDNYINNKDFNRTVTEFYTDTENAGKLLKKMAGFDDLEYSPNDFKVYENMFDAYKKATGQTTKEVQQQIINQFKEWKVSPEETQKHFRVIKEAAKEVGWQGSYEHLDYNSFFKTETRKKLKLKNADKSYRPEVTMNGNNVEIDSIYNHSVPKRTSSTSEPDVNTPDPEPYTPKIGDNIIDDTGERYVLKEIDKANPDLDIHSDTYYYVSPNGDKITQSTPIDPTNSNGKYFLDDEILTPDDVHRINHSFEELRMNYDNYEQAKGQLYNLKDAYENGADNLNEIYEMEKSVRYLEKKLAETRKQIHDDDFKYNSGDKWTYNINEKTQKYIDKTDNVLKDYSETKYAKNYDDIFKEVKPRQIIKPIESGIDNAINVPNNTTVNNNIKNSTKRVRGKKKGQSTGRGGRKKVVSGTGRINKNTIKSGPRKAPALKRRVPKGKSSTLKAIGRNGKVLNNIPRVKVPLSKKDVIKTAANLIVNEAATNTANTIIKNVDEIVPDTIPTPEAPIPDNAPDRFNIPDGYSDDPMSWTDEDIKDMANGDQDIYNELKKRRDNAFANEASDPNSDSNNPETPTPEPEPPEPMAFSDDFDPNDPSTWTDSDRKRMNDPSIWTDDDIKRMADGDGEYADDLIRRRLDAIKGETTGPSNKIPGQFEDAPVPNTYHIDAPDTEIEGFDDLGGVKRLGVVDKVMTGVNILGAVGDYKTARREGHGVVSSAVRAGAKFAVDEALGLWAIPVALVKTAPGLAIKGADMLYKENRRMNSAANFQLFGDAQFMDTQQLATMRQSGMEMAKMSQYNLQQTLMGNEATYLHR